MCVSPLFLAGCAGLPTQRRPFFSPTCHPPSLQKGSLYSWFTPKKSYLSSYWINPISFPLFSDRVCGPADTESPSLLSYYSPSSFQTSRYSGLRHFHTVCSGSYLDMSVILFFLIACAGRPTQIRAIFSPTSHPPSSQPGRLYSWFTPKKSYLSSYWINPISFPLFS